MPLTALLINDALAFVGMPGEVFVQYQLELKARAPVGTALLCGYTEEYHAYFPTLAGALAGGYGGTTASYVGFGAADRLALEALILLTEMRRPPAGQCCREAFRIVDWDPAVHGPQG